MKGAFTGAVASRAGKFQIADKGTLFLDEIGELPLNLQVKLLRALQERVVIRVGDSRPEKVDIRVVAATNRNLEDEIREGRFREDLYYRLNVVNLWLPPLRERGDDVMIIAKVLLSKYADELGSAVRGFSPGALAAIKKYAWPGNIRQLENRIKKALVLCDQTLLSPEDLDLGPSAETSILPLEKAKEEFQRKYVLEVLERNNGNRTQTARDLGVDPRTIFRYLEKRRTRCRAAPAAWPASRAARAEGRRASRVFACYASRPKFQENQRKTRFQQGERAENDSSPTFPPSRLPVTSPPRISMSPELHSQPCPPKTRADLEWDRILEALADRCTSSLGKRPRARCPSPRIATRCGSPSPRCGRPSISTSKASPSRASICPRSRLRSTASRIGAPLSNEELRAVIACLSAARMLRRFLHSRRHRAPALDAACAIDPSLEALEQDLAVAFDPDGSLADRASPRLGDLRRAPRDARSAGAPARGSHPQARGHPSRSVLDRARRALRAPGAIRRARALPGHRPHHQRQRIDGVRRAARARGDGQPPEDPRQPGRAGRAGHLRVALLAHRRLGGGDSRRGARARSRRSARRRGKLTRDLRLTFPEIAEATASGGASIELRGARHPLLALDGIEVVPSDLAVGAGRAMVVSGPNAGGKTVALKTLGLAALMLRAGLPIPAKDGSRVAIFSVVLTDVGDDQNLRKNLSTFSAHVQNLAAILDGTHPGALVLLDELAGGTDPREGEALAAGVLDSLSRAAAPWPARPTTRA